MSDDVMALLIRDYKAQDLTEIHRCNEANLPHVNSLSIEEMGLLASKTAYFKVAELDGQLAGFLMAMLVDANYESTNFQWFKANVSNFIYVDRIITMKISRGLGVASRLYEDIENFSRANGIVNITCEVNVRPANDLSLLFHEKRGFKQLATQETEGGSKSVSLRLKPLTLSK